MASISYSSDFFDDLSRLTDFLMLQNVDAALSTYDIVMDGIRLLKTHPEIGRPSLKGGLRELVISRGNTGYIALYSYDEFLDLVHVVSIWHQRETNIN
ncbi:type II toxin-antitoxin system RelE/ParE family toxin [Methylotenera sp.]|uniref:type II toxin-antitoxin system RelE/ParE family toxin n=1 Tax=Methylotenera sp. TaxID=2051956 RepID=UPI002487CA94|nr:type II toxin-antitoxin system RelE/ParE family toxin [Methylotenera sp.]MDI1299866.1 type II toxin-antitoxin system RelE/ParE family toxin [Methylotenera sp.]